MAITVIKNNHLLNNAGISDFVMKLQSPFDDDNAMLH